MPRPCLPHKYSSWIISLSLLLVNLSLIVLTTPAGSSSLADGSTSFGSTTASSTAQSSRAAATLNDNLHPTTADGATVALLAATGEKSKITAEADAQANRNAMMTPGYSRAKMATVVRSYIAISGKVTVGDQGFSNVTMLLASPDPTFKPRTIRSSSLGDYAFKTLPKGRNYRLTPSRTNYTFTPAHLWLGNAKTDLPDQDFVGVLKTFKISGQVVLDGIGLENVTMTLTCSRPVGFTPRTVTTDSNGNYVFPGVPIAGYYTLTASKKNYSFNTASRRYSSLSSNQTRQDFIATLNSYSIRGNVLVKDVTVGLSGSATATMLSDSGGNYSFPNLSPAGDYTITVSKQDYTFDSESKSFTDLSDNQIADFAITASPNHVLEYDGLLQALNYRNFWLPGMDLGHFFWEFWAMPGADAGSRYLLSDGYGGAHALLFGFYKSGSRYVIGGNIFDGTKSTVFESDEGPAPYEWGHLAVGWDGENLVTYFDGVPVGIRTWTGPRRCIGHSGGGGNLYIGGSNHQNFMGRIAQFRGYEGNNPLEDANGINSPLSAFTPQTIFDCNDSFWQNCSLLSSFIKPTRPVVDLSGNNWVGNLGGHPPPQYVIDPTAPTALDGGPPVPPANTSPPPSPAPDDALVFDSFSRQNSTYILDEAGGMGSTEGGSAGPEVWQYDNQADQKIPFGILNARAVMLSNEAHAAWVSTGSSTGNLDVSVDRWPGRFRSGISTGLVFRLQDANNFFCAYTTGATADAQMLYVASVVDGSITTLATGIAMPTTWTTLRVDTLSAGNIDVYADTTLVYSTSSNVLANATNAGLWNWGQNQGLANRWDNFTVREIPVTPPPGERKARAF